MPDPGPGLLSLVAFATTTAVRRGGAILIFITVGISTVVATVGLWGGWIGVGEALFLSGLYLVFAAIYLRFLSPNRENVPPVVTSLVGIMGAVVISITVSFIYEYEFITYLELLGVTAWLLLVLLVWMWFVLVYLGDFREGSQLVASATDSFFD